MNLSVTFQYERSCFVFKLTVHDDLCQGAGVSHAVSGVAHELARVVHGEPGQHQTAGASVALRDDVLLVLLHSLAIYRQVHHKTQHCVNQTRGP